MELKFKHYFLWCCRAQLPQHCYIGASIFKVYMVAYLSSYALYKIQIYILYIDLGDFFFEYRIE